MSSFRKNTGERKDFTPFLFGKKIDQGTTAEVFKSQQDPNILVKRLKIFVDDDFSPTLESNYTEQQFRNHYQRNLKEIQKYLGKFLPDIQLVFGSDEKGLTTGYIATEKIVKDRTIFKKGEKSKALDELLSQLLRMYISKYTEVKKLFTAQKPPYIRMPDFIGQGDLIYGHTRKNPQPQFYTPDIYPMVPLTPAEMQNKINGLAISHKADCLPLTKQALNEFEQFVRTTQ